MLVSIYSCASDICVVCNEIHEVGASQQAETCKIYCFSNTSVVTKILPTFRPCCSGLLQGEDLCPEEDRSNTVEMS